MASLKCLKEKLVHPLPPNEAFESDFFTEPGSKPLGQVYSMCPK